MTSGRSQSTPKPALGIYIHWPFCLSRCPYCDFNAHIQRIFPSSERWCDAYRKDFDYIASRYPDVEITSIFFGGGTPSLAPPAVIDGILNHIAACCTVAADIEITLEANPTAAEYARLADLRAAGINRISLGVQSFDDEALRFLGRRHDAATARQALEAARNLFPELSLDLIYGRPGQNPASWPDELEEALSWSENHLSLYQLTVEPGTPFAAAARRGSICFPDADTIAPFQQVTLDYMDRAGLPAYEISNFARPGHACRHNLNYWRSGDWIGIGPGAHGRLRSAGQRWASVAEAHPERWLKGAETGRDSHGGITLTALTSDEEAEEYLLMGLRLSEGIARVRYENLGGVIDDMRLAEFCADGLMTTQNNHIAATMKGFMVLDSLITGLSAVSGTS